MPRQLLHLTLCLVVMSMAAPPAAAGTAPSPSAAGLLTCADSLSAAADLAGARRAYTAVLAIDPNRSRAVYQLALLTPERREAERLLRHYVGLEPHDAWGWLALGEMLAAKGKYGEALQQYDTALRLAPGEREVALGRARTLGRAGRTDAAITAFQEWLEAHPADAEAWSDLGRERRKAGRLYEAAGAFEAAIAGGDARAVARRDALQREMAPAVEPFVAGSGDSDGNDLLRRGLALDVATPGRGRIGMRGSRLTIEDAAGSQDLDELRIETTWRPLAVLRLQVAPGVTRIPGERHSGGVEWLPTLQARVGWQAASVPAILDLRATRELLTASPLLLENRVQRSEALVRAQLPVVAGLQVRGSGRFATLDSRFDHNRRRAVQGGLALVVRSGVEFSAQLLDQRYDHPSADGYFAPSVAQLAEAGAYLETESLGPLSLAIDLGAGVQRVTAFDSVAGPWEPAFRVWAQLGLALGAGCRLHLECEGYDSQSGIEMTTAGGWRYGFAAASLRLPLP